MDWACRKAEPASGYGKKALGITLFGQHIDPAAVLPEGTGHILLLYWI